MSGEKRDVDAEAVAGDDENEFWINLAKIIDEQAEKENAIPIVVAKRGVLVCSQCASHVETAAIFRTEHYRRTLIVCPVCLKTASNATLEADK